MGKLLVTKNNLSQFMEQGDSEFYVEQKMILSPSAKDMLRNKNITIVYGQKKQKQKQEQEQENDESSQIVTLIAKVLVEDFKIYDQNKINCITKRVLERIDL
ncbi:hypothetical protein PV797_16400 [Clostridiaceae bacterium M8S5]|nr:hypothetical protein PV797_16400 [Clostridiaceae bacterium M8S5]